MTDLSVLIPDSTCPADVDRFCDSIRTALLRNQQAGRQPNRAVAVEFVGVFEAGQQRDRESEINASCQLDDVLQSALDHANGNFVVRVPDTNHAEAAERTVEMFSQRRSLPIFFSPQSDNQPVAAGDAEALTPVNNLQTSALTSVCDDIAVCQVLRNRISVPRPTVLKHSSTPWIGRRDQPTVASAEAQACVTWSQSAEHSQLSATGNSPRNAEGSAIRTSNGLASVTSEPASRGNLRPIVLVATLAGVSWFLWGSSSLMTAATGRPVDGVADSSNEPENQTDQTTVNTEAAGRRQNPVRVDRQATSGTPGNTATNITGSTNSSRSAAGAQAVQRNSAGDSSPRSTNGVLDSSEKAIEQRILADASYLASDELEGRGAQTQGLERAAEYLARQFTAAGLNTSHFNGTPFQEFELLSIGGESPVQQVEFRGSDGVSRRLVPDQDFASLLLSRSAKLDVGVAFAGFGISAPEVGYDDYQGIDVAGNAVVILRHAPQVFATESDDLAEHSYVRTKIAAASARGASAVLLCSDLASLANESKSRSPQKDKLLNVELTLDDGVRPVPVIHCRRDVLKELLHEFSGFDLDSVEREIAQSSKPASQILKGLSLTGHVSQLRRGRTLNNVVATLDPPEATTDETIIVGAHYDHLGRGGWGSLTLGANDEVHNGADDNASGTAVLLEVSRQLAAQKTPLRRRVLFIGFSAEELGLIGSRKYVKEPLIPIDQSVAMLNLDMVGRLRNDRLTVYGTGSSKSWTPLLDALAPQRNLTIIGKASGYGPSDHASFYEAGVPVLHFFTGFHPQYHRPEDDVEYLNIDGMRRIASLVVDLVTALAQAEDRPQRSLASNSDDDSALMLGLAGLGSFEARPSHPTLGIIPVERQSGQSGVLVRQTVSRSLADLHGIRTGDVIIRIGKRRIESVEQLASEVRAQPQGEKLPIELVRNGIRMEVRVQF